MLTCAELFAQKLREADLNFESGNLDNGDSVVEFPYEGKLARIFFSGDDGEYMSIYEVYDRVPEENYINAIKACNELNCQYKWITFYVDGDNDVILHLDALLTVDSAAEVAFELLARMMKVANDVKSRLMKAIYT